jgi:hypothetical protein
MSTKSQKAKPRTNEMVNSGILDKITVKNALLIMTVLLLIILVSFYKPYVIDRLEPAGVDKMASVAQSKYIINYQQTTHNIPLWNPAIFCGIPIYYASPSSAIDIDILTSKINAIIDWRLSWFILAAIGMFLIFKMLEFPWYYALVGIIAFLFFPHYQALLNVGHFAKFRAAMAMPLVIFGFLYLIKKRNLISLLLFTILFSLQLRTQHYQIIFYTLLLLTTIGIWQIIEWIKSAQQKNIGVALGLFVLGLGLAVLMSAQPLFVANEYTPYSTRGGQAISLKDEVSETAVKSSGVTFEYATLWSLSPKELMTLLVPRFYGGTSQEVYSGKTYPQLRGREVPGYWGDMPFTQSSEYLGIITVILAVLGIWLQRKNGLIISLTVLLLFSLLLAFGRHFPPLYKALFLHLPYFSKFRVPMMILILTSFITILLAMFGLKSISGNSQQNFLRPVLIVSGFFFLVGLVPLTLPGILSFASPNDHQIISNPQVLAMLQTIRREFMQTDTLRMLVFIGAFAVLYYFFARRKIGKDLLIIGIFVLISVDMISISARFLDRSRLVNQKSMERSYFKLNSFDKIILADDSYHRVLGIGNLFQSNDLAYRHQIVGGYSPIKPQLIQDIVDNNLYTNDPNQPVNWKVANMLNAKYIISPAQLPKSALTLMDVDQNRRTLLYKNYNALPRAYFVKTIKRFPDEKEVVRFLNNPDFDPSVMALTSETINDTSYSAKGQVTIRNYTPNKIELSAACDDTAFLVLSEAYYPTGWNALIDSHKTHIYQVNHILRGIVIPPGDHQITFRFLPKSYVYSNRISTVFLSGAWISLALTLIYKNQGRIKTWLKKHFPMPRKKD